MQRAGSFALSLLLLSAATTAPAATTFRKVVLAAHCDNPMELTVLPDGRVLFLERFGNARLCPLPRSS